MSQNINTRIIQLYYSNSRGWVRVFRRGINWKDVTKHNLIFSERIGISKGVQVGKWRFRKLIN